MALSYAESDGQTDAVCVLDLELARKLASAFNEVCENTEAHLDGGIKSGELIKGKVPVINGRGFREGQ